MNPLAIRIAADLKAFKANMAEMRTQLETNASAMKRMSSAFDGSKVIGDANAMVKAIHDIGGAAKLTEAEQKRVNATVTEALAKYHALGREAPAELLALRDATNKVEAATKQVGPPVESLTGKLKGMAGMLGIAFGGAAVVAGVKSLISSTFEYAETIKDTSAKLGVSMEATQRWKFAAEQTGASIENVSKSVLKLSQGLAGGDKGVKEALAIAGLEFEKIRAMKPEDGFNAVFEAVAKIPDPMLQAKLMLELFGKSGAELIPAMREGFSDLAKGVKTMSDETIKRLDDAKDKWEELGRTVTIVTGEMIGDTAAGFEDVTTILENFGQIFKAWKEGGVDAALRLTGELGRFKNAIFELTDAQKKEVNQLLKNGIPANQIYDKSLGQNEASVLAYIASLKKSAPPLKQFGEDNKKAAKETKESWSGTLKDIFNYSELVQLELDAASKVSWSGTIRDLKEIEQIWIDLRAESEEPLSVKWLKAGSFSGTIEDLKNLEQIFIGEGNKGGVSFMDAFANALDGLGGVIVGAIQGGGSVGKAAFASIGSSLGDDLGKLIAKGIGGSLGKAIGGFAGPLGALAGSVIGGALDKILGKNEGRDNAKAFAATFGGFDSLLKKMVDTLGPSYEKLWVDLTQNTKGPAQVAQAIKAIEDALRKAEDAAGDTAKALEDAFKGPEGARGFPTRAQLQKAATEAKEAYDYMLASGEYTADVLTQAWDQWQEAMIASGDVTAKRMKELTAEIATLQKAVEAETPEYDVNGVRKYGVEEMRNIERLAALEAEKSALEMARIAEEERANVTAAEKADLQAKKEFEAAKLRAINLDDEMRRIFSKGYDIPIRFQVPGMPGGGSSGGSYNGSLYGGGIPTGAPAAGGGTARITIMNVIPLDGAVVARNQVTHIAKLLPNELAFTGALRR